MAEFSNVKIIGAGTDSTVTSRSSTGDQSDGTAYNVFNVLNLDEFWVASNSGSVKASLTTLSATLSTVKGVVGSTSAASLTAVAFLPVKTDTGRFYKIPLLDV